MHVGNAGMETDRTKIAILQWLVVAAAISVGYVAHHEFDVSLQEIRTVSASSAFAIAPLLAIDYFGRILRKSK
jgi:hypothetical protein